MPTNKNTKTQKKAKPKIPPLTIENATIIYRNFAGEGKRFNAEGLRNFHVLLDHDLARKLESDGWNIKWPKPRDDGEERNPTLKVRVRFDNYPPYIVLISKRGQVVLDEDTVGLLDTAEIVSVDLKVTGSYNELETGWKGYTTYLSKLFVTISDDDLMAKHMPVNNRNISEKDDND